MSIEINDESGRGLDGGELADLARFVLDEMRIHPQAELAITIVGSQTMAELNKRWMDETGPTDVLSFPMDELRPTRPGDSPVEGMLGDLVLCHEVAAQQARAAGHSTAEEILLLTTHGILHLLGYNHENKDQETEMFGLQRRLLLTFLAGRAGTDDVRVPEPTTSDHGPSQPLPPPPDPPLGEGQRS